MRLLAAILIVLAGFLPFQAKAFTMDDMVETFVELALSRSNYNTGPGTIDHLMRWERTLIVKIMQGGTPERAAALDAQLQHLAGLTGITFVYQGFFTGHENYRVYFVDHPDEVILLGKEYGFNLRSDSACFTAVFRDDNSMSIQAGVVVIQTDPEYYAHCMIEETAQSLGLLRDSDRIRPTMFSDLHHLTRMTPLDEAFLRVLYDKRLRSGMKAPEFRRIGRDVIRDYVD